MICIACSSLAKFEVKDGCFWKPVCTFHAIKYARHEHLPARPLDRTARV